MYSDFIKEQFERCLDLYLCPRVRTARPGRQLARFHNAMRVRPAVQQASAGSRQRRLALRAGGCEQQRLKSATPWHPASGPLLLPALLAPLASLPHPQTALHPLPILNLKFQTKLQTKATFHDHDA
jgi:hypothetical protein